MPHSVRSFNDVQHPQDGEAVNASVTGRASRSLEAQVRYLLERVDAIVAGEAIFLDNMTLHPDVEEGFAVYWDAENGRFDLALAEMEHNAETGYYVLTARAHCIGICYSKTTATTGKILLLGAADLSETAYANLGSPTTGAYYLSSTTPGHVTAEAPAVAVLVMHVLGTLSDCDSNATVFVHTHHRSFLEEHVHHSIELFAVTAGDHTTPATEADPHEITDPDPDLVGWLPADHAVFLDKAPAGAAFGYNIEAHDALAKIWPPIPPQAAVLECLPGGDTNLDALSRVPPELVQIDSNGIWWMTDCYGQVPWPTSYDGTSGSSDSSGCPIVLDMRLILSFAKMTFATNKSVVTSLRPADGQPIQLQNENGEPATTGDLYILLDISSSIASDEAFGGEVLKTLTADEDGFVLNRGWVVEGVKSSSAQLTVSSTRSRLVDPAEEESVSNPKIHQGIVTIGLDLEAAGKSYTPLIERLGGAIVQEYLGITYTGFPEDRDSLVRLQFVIPQGAIVVPSTMKLRALMFGRDTGPWSEMTASYYRIARPTDGTPTELLAGDTVLTFDVVTPSDDYDGEGTNLPPDNAIIVESEEFDVEDGDTIYVSLERLEDASPAFDAEIAMIWIVGIVSPVE